MGMYLPSAFFLILAGLAATLMFASQEQKLIARLSAGVSVVCIVFSLFLFMWATIPIKH